MVKPNDLKDVEILLGNCKTVQQMFDVLQRKFDLHRCEPGMISKPLFIKGIIKGIQLVNPPLK
jgi:hypothetical protein